MAPLLRLTAAVPALVPPVNKLVRRGPACLLAFPALSARAGDGDHVRQGAAPEGGRALALQPPVWCACTRCAGRALTRQRAARAVPNHAEMELAVPAQHAGECLAAVAARIGAALLPVHYARTRR